MFKFVVFTVLMGALTPLLVAQARADAVDKPCEDTVDLAETAQFHRLYFDCAKSKKDLVVKTYEAATVATDVATDVAAEKKPIAGAEYLVRASLASGTATALDDLFGQMASYCPKGWRKLDEWVEPEAAGPGYFLHYKVKCL